jgi:hypothetical protein
MSERDTVEFELKPRTLLAGYAIILAIALVPIFAFDVVPLGDWPNHLARAYILNRLPADADLQKYYVAHWRLFSFQSTDLVLPGLIGLFGLSGANGYVAATFLLLMSGTVAVHRTLFGRVGLWPACAALFLFNLPLAVGQVSFLLAAGLALLLLAAWIATDRHRGPKRTAGFAVGALALFFCHFFAFAAYAVAVMAFEATGGRRDPVGRRLWRMPEAGLQFVIPGACFLLAFSGAIHGETAYGSIVGKPLVWMSAVVTYARWSDIVVTIAIGSALWLLEKRRLLRFAPGMRWAAVTLLLLAIAMPHMLSGVLGADIRLPCLLAFLLVACSDVQWRGHRQAAVFAVGVVAVLSFRVATIMVQWQGFDADYREFRAADAVLDRGSRVLVIPFTVDYRDQGRQSLTAYSFISSFAVIDRDVLTQQLYTFATPLEFSSRALSTIGPEAPEPRDVRWQPTDPRYASADRETARQVEDVAGYILSKSLPSRFIDWSDWPERYDYVIDLDFGRHENRVPALLTEIRRGSFFAIYRLHPPRP